MGVFWGEKVSYDFKAGVEHFHNKNKADGKNKDEPLEPSEGKIKADDDGNGGSGGMDKEVWLSSKSPVKTAKSVAKRNGVAPETSHNEHYSTK